jgi:transposase-like protein
MIHRRQCTAAFNAQVVRELLSGAQSRAEWCREHHMAAAVLADWQTVFLRHAPAACERPAHRHGPEATRVAALERLVGRFTLENASLNQATRILPQRSRPSGRASRGAASSLLGARAVGGWEPRAAATTRSLTAALRRP